MTFGLSDYVMGSALAMIAVVWITWRSKSPTVGLPLCYLFSLAMIHFLGGLIYLLPWFETFSAPFVVIGFREYFFSVLAFVGGVSLVELIERHTRRQEARRTARGLKAANVFPGPRAPVFSSPDRGTYGRARRGRETRNSGPKIREAYLPAMYLILGVLFVGIFIPILRSVPSIGAVASCGAYLMVVGFCLMCWRCWMEGKRGKFFVWLLLTLGFPAFTTLTMGFIGYGTAAMLIVLVFVTTFYRPRWQVVLCGFLLVYIGLSAFVTYMRDRTAYREGLQSGEGISLRATRLVEMFTKFEFFRPRDEYHLAAVDARLNQNWLVGTAVANLDLGSVPFARGDTLVQALQAMVPRLIWPDKPVRAGSPEIVSYYTGVTFAEETSVGVGQVMEFYINFGRTGIIVGFLLLGILVKRIDAKAGGHLANGNVRGFVTWFLPGLTLLNVGGSLVEVTATGLASIMLVIGVNKFVISGPNPHHDRRQKRIRRPGRAETLPGPGGRALKE